MAALHFIYSTMNAGKSTALLQASHGYRERGLETMVFTSSKDDRYGESEVVSRVGLRTSAHTYTESDNICLLYTSPSPRDGLLSRMPSSA